MKDETDDDIKAELPHLMKGVIQLYSTNNSQVLPMLYQMKFSIFMKREILNGRRENTLDNKR